MKYSSLIVSTLLGSIAHEATAAEANCCHAAVDKGCPSPYVDGSQFIIGSFTISGIATVPCCLTSVTASTGVVDNMQLCPGSEPPATTSETTTGADPFSGDTGGESSSSIFSGSEFGSSCSSLRELFPDCSCIIFCQGSNGAQCIDVPSDACDTSSCPGGSGTACHNYMTYSESSSSSSSSSTTTTTTSGSTSGSTGTTTTNNANASTCTESSGICVCSGECPSFTDGWAQRSSSSVNGKSSCVAMKDGGSTSNSGGVVTINGTPYTVVDPCPGTSSAGMFDLYYASILMGAAAVVGGLAAL